MQSRSPAWETLAAGGYFLLETKAVIGSTDYTQISSPVIKRGLFQDRLSVGNCSAASLQLSIKTDDTIPGSAEIKIYQRLLSEPGGTPTEWLPAGSFYIASRSRDYASGLVTLQCYDAMLKTREDYFADGVIVGTWPKSMTDVVAEIAQKIGVQVDPRTTISAGQIPAPVSYTLMDVLGFIGGVCGGNWIITEEEKLRLVPLADAPTSESTDAYAITAVLGSLQSGKTMTISRVTMTSGEGEEAVTYTAGDDTGYELVVGNNPYATQDICDDLLDTLGGLVYAPFSASNAICDPAMELGDKITYGDTLYSIIVQEDRTLGVAYRNTISAPADEEIEDEYPYISGAAKESQRLQREVDNARKVASNYLSADTTGIMVANMTDGTVQTPSEATGRNVFIDNYSVNIRDGLTELASFGEVTQIGESSNNHIIIDSRRIKMEDSSAVTFFEVYDLREDGIATITEIFTGDGQTTSFAVMLLPSSTVSVVDSSNPSNTYTRSRQTYTLGSAPASRATITITYNTLSSEAKAFTLGTRLNGSTSGSMSVAEGVEVTASAYAAHAEGWKTVASGPRSHAEGTLTHAEEKYSHAEGDSTYAHGESAHAEGHNTTASGDAAHSEGKLASAMGDNSHAEGFYTCAAANNSHAQNNHTDAYSADQTVLGRYNVWDTNDAYSVIVGNGTSSSTRSNALALTWDGNPLLGLAPFQRTSDTVIDSTKTYYQYDLLEEKYVVVTNPDVSEIESYYELTGTDGDLYAAVTALGWEGEVIG